MSLGFFKQFHRRPEEDQEGGSRSLEADNMASRKRSRNLNDIDGEVEVESATSSLRQTHQKRSKTALAAERGGSVVSDDDDDEEDGLNGYLEDPEYGTITPAHYSDRGDDNEDIDELRATQIVQKQIREHRDNIASEEGVIEEVYCRNFMCHSKLRIKLGPLINFIIGHNGSGKSAVLTALTMCLGGKATSTNRGASMKSLIKEGEESATLAVQIKNRGDSAYKPELYGRSITVERHFNRNGTSGFKLKSAEDKIVSTKKGDLDDILDYFAFQLDNPINVLTQDMARQFLSNSTPADKYKFFIRGTQLETLDSDYKILEEHLDAIEAKLHNRQGDMAALEQKAQDAERKKKRLDRSQAMTEKIERTRCMHAWAQVEEQERLLEQYSEQVEHAEQTVEQRLQAAETSDGTYEGHNQAYEAADRTVTQLREQLQPLQEERNASKEVFDANKTQLLEYQSQERAIREDRKTIKAEVTKLENNVKTEQQRLADAEGPEHVERLGRLEELRSAVLEAEEAQARHANDEAELLRQRDAAYHAEDAAKPALERAQEEFNRAKGRLIALQRDQGRPYEGYRPNMEQLVRAVNNETRWRSKPVGPMGNFVSLLKPEWSSVVEKTFGAGLDGFCVTNSEDKGMLNQIMGRVNCRPAIFIGSAEPLDTTGKEPDDDIDTILRVLRVENDAVRNTLIINNAIDQTALISSHKEADGLIVNRARNVRAAICPGNKRGEGYRYENSRSGQTKSSPIEMWTGAARMKTDREEQIRMQRETVNHADQEVKRHQQLIRQHSTALAKATQAHKAFRAQQSTIKQRCQKAEDDVEALQNEIERSRPQDGKLQELERQLAEAKENLQMVSNSFMDLENEKAAAGEKGAELKADLDAKERALAKANAQLTKAEQRVSDLNETRKEALKQKNLVYKDIDMAKAHLNAKTTQRDEQRRLVEEDFLPAAGNICPRIPVEEGVTPAILDQRLEKFAKDLEQMQREAGGTREELTLAYQQAKFAYDDAMSKLAEMGKVAKRLKDTLSERQHRWKMFQKFITFRARLTFTYLLSERQFRGQVLVDHTDKLLDIKVEPDLARVSDAGRTTKTLSGGEKSFSTICLLLSIWEAMGSPIRCLDEFDVFMDSVNRATSMTMMIQAARRSVGRQFILITPQSMNNVEMGDDVRVHRMTDPERGQTALPFTQV